MQNKHCSPPQEIHKTIMAAHSIPQKSCYVASSSVCHQDTSFAYTLQIDNRNTTKTHCIMCDSNFFVTMEELSSTDSEIFILSLHVSIIYCGLGKQYTARSQRVHLTKKKKR